MVEITYFLFDFHLFSEAKSCFQILKLGFFLGSIITQIRIILFIIIKLYIGQLKLIRKTLSGISKTNETIALPNVYLPYYIQNFINKMNNQMLPFYNVFCVFYFGIKYTIKYYIWKRDFSLNSLNYSAMTFAMFPVGIYKNMAVHGKKRFSMVLVQAQTL